MPGRQCLASTAEGLVQVTGDGGWYSSPPGAELQNYTECSHGPTSSVAAMAPIIHLTLPPALSHTAAEMGNFPTAAEVGVSRCRLVWLASPLPPSERARLGPQTLVFCQYLPTVGVVLALVVKT